MNLPKRLEERIHSAAQSFWDSRTVARSAQMNRGGEDRGERAAVTSGRNLDGFRLLLGETLAANGLSTDAIFHHRRAVGLPGFFRPTKLWDIVAVRNGRLVLALELKSLGGPSFGNNSNNRCEEAIGSGYDFRQAQSVGAFGRGASPFLGYFILVEDALGSRKPVEVASPHFPADPAFQNGSYQTRMRVLCERLMEQQLYDCAAVLTTPRERSTGKRYPFADLSPETSFRKLVTRLAAHVAAECT